MQPVLGVKITSTSWETKLLQIGVVVFGNSSTETAADNNQNINGAHKAEDNGIFK